MTKVYLAHSLSDTANKKDSIRVANRIRELGYDVTAVAENAAINNKANNPTPIDIYENDVTALLNSDIVVVNLSGNLQDGTVTEIGAVAGFNEHLSWFNTNQTPIKIIGYTSNERLAQPQHHKGIPSASANHLTLGAIETWGEFVGSEDNMIEKLTQLLNK